MDRIERSQHSYLQSQGAVSAQKTGSPQAAVSEQQETPVDLIDLKGTSQKPPKKSGTVDIHLLHLNDIHGNIEPQIEKGITNESAVGGLAFMASTVKQLRAESPASILLNAGDIAQGSFESELSQGKPIMDVINYLGFDAVELGNHDFAMGRAALQTMIGHITAPILGANIQSIATSKTIDGVQPSLIKEVSGVKVGIIGVDTPKVPEYVRPEELVGMKFPEPEKVVKEQIELLKRNGADIIVVLSHLGLAEDRDLAKKVEGIDVIVGGHTHTALPEGEKVNNTIIAQAGCNNQYVGDLTLTIDTATKKIKTHRNRLVLVRADKIKPDAAIEKMLEPYLKESARVGSEVVGKADGDFSYSYQKITPLGQHIADAARKAAGTQLSLISGKMLRSGLKNGDITKKQLFNSYPNNEDLVSLKIQGKHIKEELEKRFATDSRAVIIPSGFSFNVDNSRPDGDRITSITVDGKPMDMEAEYPIAVTDNQARYPAFKTAKDIVTISSLKDAWFDYVKESSPLSNALDGRVTISG
ncbi:MAG: bifunctional UDP-sugar hydrolase/5'-nucleotidase [Vulcanimicrobiota bacterium]